VAGEQKPALRKPISSRREIYDRAVKRGYWDGEEAS
jgi:hypothetical protein